MGTQKKPKRKNSEKRKEKSRDAARSRRSKETEVFSDLSSELPVPISARDQMDKASIMRLCIGHLKLRKLVQAEAWYQGKSEEKEMDPMYLKALDGFLMVVDDAGDMIYMSDNSVKYLGITQYDLMGQSIYEFTHPCDHDEIREILSEKMTNEVMDHTFFIRIKSTLTSKGRSINLKSATYKVVQCTGHMLSVNMKAPTGLDGERHYMAVICSPIPHPANIESPLDGRTFLTRHNLDMTFSYCDERIADLLGFSEEELIGQSVYNYHHAMDSEKVAATFRDLFHKGQSVTGLYRFLARDGGFAWVESQCTVIYNSRTEKAQCVVCIHFVVSGVQDAEVILSQFQLDVQPRSKVSSKALPAKQPYKPPQPTPKEEKPHTTFTRATETVFQALPKPAAVLPTATPGGKGFTEATKPPAKAEVKAAKGPSFCGVTESMFHPRTPAMEQPDFCKPANQVLQGFPRNEDKLLFVAPSMGEIDGGEKQKSVSSVFLDEVLFGDRQDSPQKEMPFLSTGVVPKRKEKYTNLDCSDCESIKSRDGKSTPERMASPMGFSTNLFEWDNQNDMDYRAPFIPMSGEEDLIFSAIPVLLVDHLDEEPREMLGATETIFAPNPDAKKAPSTMMPLSILKQKTVNTQFMPEGNVARNAGPPKTKRPMETNRLETGPPVKVCKATEGINEPNMRSSAPNKSDDLGASVLRNLLLCGKDENFGYTIPEAALSEDSNDSGAYASSLSPAPNSPWTPQKVARTLIQPESPVYSPNITQHDMEVNVPVQSSTLLQGVDLLTALEDTTY